MFIEQKGVVFPPFQHFIKFLSPFQRTIYATRNSYLWINHLLPRESLSFWVVRYEEERTNTCRLFEELCSLCSITVSASEVVRPYHISVKYFVRISTTAAANHFVPLNWSSIKDTHSLFFVNLIWVNFLEVSISIV